MIFKKISAVLAVAIAINTASVINVNADSALTAFPGAEGGGMYTQGARAGTNYQIYHVTNLGESGLGTFADAVSNDNRIIVFDVAGNINLSKRLHISASNLTILGQTAPGEGVCIGGEGVYITGSQIIMRYMRFRMGDNSTSQEDALGGKDASNIILDHCSVSWSEDEDLSFYAVKDFTAQYCIISESLNQSNHAKGAHGYGGIWGGENASFHHNLIASHNSRTPRIGTSATVSSYKNKDDRESLVDIRNNVIYNWGSNSAYGGENGVRVNLVNNYYKPGPATQKIRFYQHYAASSNDGLRNDGTTLYADGNIMEGDEKLTADNWAGVDTYSDDITWTKCDSISDGVEYNGKLLTNDQYIYDYPITTQTAENAYNDVIANAGASLVRDSIDERVVNDVINGTAPTGSVTGYGLIDSQEDVGGWCELYGAVEQDTDGDGIPDSYEDANGLDKNNSSDGVSLAPSGYTNTEEYANYLAAHNTSDIDRSSLRKAVAAAEEINRNEYTDDTLEALDLAVENAKTVLGTLSSTQEDIDNALKAIEEALNTLDVDYANYLRVKIAEAEEYDKSLYTAESYGALVKSIEKGKAVLETEYNRTAYKSAYDEIVSAINALEESARVKLLVVCDDMKLLSPIDCNNWEEYAALVAQGEKLGRDLTAAEAEYENLITKIETAKAALKGNFSDTVVWECNFNKIKSSNVFRRHMDELTDYGATEDESMGFYVNGAEVIFPNNKYNSDGYFCGFKSVGGSNAGYVKSKVIESVKEDGITYYSDEVPFESGQSLFESCDICFISDISNYAGSVIFKALPTNTPFTVTLVSENTLEISFGGNVYTKAFSFEPEKWYKLALCINRDENTLSFSVGGETLIDNAQLPSDYNGKLYGYINVYNASANSGSLIGVDNFSFCLREYAAEPVYTVVYPFTGDADGNGILTANDSAWLLYKVRFGDAALPIEKENDGISYIYKVDADADGVLTASDAALILKKVINSAFKLPGENVSIIVESSTETTSETSSQTSTETSSEATTKTSTEVSTEITTETTTEPHIIFEPTTDPIIVGIILQNPNSILTKVLEQAVIKEPFF